MQTKHILEINDRESISVSDEFPATIRLMLGATFFSRCFSFLATRCLQSEDRLTLNKIQMLDGHTNDLLALPDGLSTLSVTRLSLETFLLYFRAFYGFGCST